MTVGTVAYAAPEQLKGEDIDGRADQYGLAATAYHLLTGEQLFPQSNPAVVISHHLSAKPPLLAAKHPELAALDPVLARALSKDPADRYRRCTDFARALNAATSADAHAASAPTASAPKAEATMPAALAGERNQAAPSARSQVIPHERAGVGGVAAGRGATDSTRWNQWLKPSRLGLIVLALMLVAALVFVVIQLNSNRETSSPQQAAPAMAKTQSTAPVVAPPTVLPSSTPTTAPRPVFAADPVRLQFNDLNLPKGLAVDSSGNLIIGDWNTEGGRLLKLAAGATAPTVLPITGLGGPCAITINGRNDIYVLDDCSNAGSTLLKIPAGSTTPIELSPKLPAGAKDIAIDTDDNLYLVCSNDYGSWVEKLAPGATNPTELPHPGVDAPSAITVDTDKNVYIADYTGKVIKLPAGSNTPTALPFTGLSQQIHPTRIAVDAAGTVYVVAVHFDSSSASYSATSTVSALPAGAPAPIPLNFSNMLNQSDGIAVDSSGVYVISDGSTSTDHGYVVLLRRSE
jgi:hypothetical protein